jgi:hypothetical protein
MNDNRLGLLPRLAEAVEILVVMEWIAATPVHQTNVGVVALVSVKAVWLPRIEQHVGNTRDRYGIWYSILPTRQGWAWESFKRHPDTADRPVTIPYAATRQPDLTQHRSQGRCHPIGLLSILRTLKRPRDCNQSSRISHLFSEIVDRRGWNTAYIGCPSCCFWLTIGIAEQIAFKAFVTRGTAIKKLPIHKLFKD